MWQLHRIGYAYEDSLVYSEDLMNICVDENANELGSYEMVMQNTFTIDNELIWEDSGCATVGASFINYGNYSIQDSILNYTHVEQYIDGILNANFTARSFTEEIEIIQDTLRRYRHFETVPYSFLFEFLLVDE